MTSIETFNFRDRAQARAYAELGEKLAVGDERFDEADRIVLTLLAEVENRPIVEIRAIRQTPHGDVELFKTTNIDL